MLGKRYWLQGTGAAPRVGSLSLGDAGRTSLHVGAGLSAWLGLTFSVQLLDVGGLSPQQLRGLIGLAVAWLMLGLTLGVAEAKNSRLAQLDRGLSLLWRAALPLGTLPLLKGDLRLIPGLVSVALAVRDVPAGTFSRLHERREWQLALLGFAGTLGIAFVSVGRTLTGSVSNDSAYYYGVARYLVKSHQYREPIVWQFLNQAPTVLHRPFDYWHGFTSLFFVPIFAVFGSSFRVAGTTMGLVSGSTVVLFAYLVSVAAPLRNAGLQILVVLLFALAPTHVGVRFDVETIPFVHVWLLVALIALAKRRLALASLAACLMFAARADTASLSALLCLATAHLAFEQPDPARALYRVVLTVSGFLLCYVVYHLVLFGTPGPPGALVAARLSDNLGPYSWNERPPTWTWAERITPGFVSARVQAGVGALMQADFFPNYWVFLGCALIRSVPEARQRQSLDRVVRLLVFAGAAAIAWASPAVFAWWRSVHPLLPAFVLAGAYGAETLLEALCRFLRARHAPPAWARLAAGLATWVFGFGVLAPVKFTATELPPPAFTQELADFGQTFAGQTVMSGRSWYVLAYTDALAVGLPFNGEAAIATVLRRYQVKWLLLANGEPLLGSTDITNQVLAGTRQDIGGVPLHLVRRSALLTLFQVD